MLYASQWNKRMTHEGYNVLFICAGNSARSILAESLMNHWGRGQFKGYSAGSFPKETVHPYALDLLRSAGLPVEGLRTKSWDEFAQPGAPVMDFVFTVCDQVPVRFARCGQAIRLRPIGAFPIRQQLRDLSRSSGKLFAKHSTRWRTGSRFSPACDRNA